MTRQRISILGSTGSIGCSTLEVISRHPERFEVYALGAKSSRAIMEQQCRRFKPRFAVLSDPAQARELADDLAGLGLGTRVLGGAEGLEQIAADPSVDVVMAAIVGAAGLKSSLAAAEAGKRLLLANKEALVMAGGLFMAAVNRGGAELLPIDSEHNAIFQCLPKGYRCGTEPGAIRRILLTASGGPFLTTPMDELPGVTPEQAIAHPNWEMGRKISVDSATMMNKGLEVIEACHLFKISQERIEVVVHPQSIVHSMVEYNDGSVLAQLGNPDMRTPIASALAWPDRIESGVSSLDFIGCGHLEFQSPDLERFPCLGLAIDTARIGGCAGTVLNAANEVAVQAFLAGELRFDQIADLIGSTLGDIQGAEPVDLAMVQEIDQKSRRYAADLVDQEINRAGRPNNTWPVRELKT